MTKRTPRDTTPRCHACGWVGKTTTAGLAARALQLHSCAKQHRNAELLARALARHNAIDRTPKPCRHKQARHQHGTRTCYVLDRCRCLPCATASSNYEIERRRANTYGRGNLTDAAPVRAHVAALTASGVGLKTVARRTGVAHGALWELVYGKKGSTPSKRVCRDTAEAILALPLGQQSVADGARIASVGTARRVQALVACGWSVNQIAFRSGLDRQRLDGALKGRDVVADTARRAKTLYDQIWDQPPPEHDHRSRIAAARSRNRARAAGWPPPLAWDDDTIDDPGAGPQVTPIRVTHPNRVVHPDDVEWLVRAGGTWESIAARLGVRKNSIEIALRRDGRTDLIQRLSGQVGA